MFSMFREKVDYKKIFSSANDIHQYIYGNRSKTVEIFENEKFIEAWLASKNTAEVTTIIRNEAIKGDIPSIKQMIWLSDLCFKNAENLTRDRNQQLRIKIDFLTDRIMFCERAIDLGLRDESYPAMCSCVNLYSILAPLQSSISDETIKNALNGVVKHANMCIKLDHVDPDLINHAKELLKQYAPIAKLTSALNARESSDNIKITEAGDIESLIGKYGTEKAGNIIRGLAANGNLFCQIFLSAMGLQLPEKHRTSEINQDIELFTKLAAEGGDPGSQFNLAIILVKKVELSNSTFSEQDIQLMHKSKYWHEKAAAQGFTPSIHSLRTIKKALGEL
jgi:hypothetical protein